MNVVNNKSFVVSAVMVAVLLIQGAQAMSQLAQAACEGADCPKAAVNDKPAIKLRGAGSAPTLAEIAPAAGLKASDYADRSPAELMDYSWHSPSFSEKAAIRSHLAKNHPDTESGLAARAWLADVEESDGTKAVELLNRCLAINTKNLYCHGMLASFWDDLGRPREKAAVYQAMLDIDPAFNFHSTYRYLYFTYLNGTHDKAAADRLLAQVRQQLPDSAVLLSIEAGLRGLSGELKAQEELYERAIEAGVLEYDVHEFLADLRFFDLAKKEPGKREQALEGMLEYVDYVRKAAPTRRDLIQKAYLYIAQRAARELKDAALAQEYYARAFREYPTAEAAVEAYDSVMAQYPHDSEPGQLAVRFLHIADRALPNEPMVLAALGRHYASRSEIEKAKDYLERAVGHSVTGKDRIKHTITLAQALYEDRLLNFDKARMLLKQSLDGVSERHVAYPDLLKALYVDRLDAGDFAGALSALNDLESFRRKRNDINEAWFVDRRRQLLAYLDDEKPTESKSMSQLRRIGPEAAPRAVSPGKVMAISPDGRFIAFGSYPMQLWDVQKKTKVRDLGRAGRAKFSPDGRYIAASSNFTAEGGFQTHELIVYDVATGRVHARDAVSREIRDFDWDPTGSRIVYVGDVVGPAIYDVEKRKRVLRRPAPGNQIVNGVAWLRQGLIVTGQAGADHLLVWDAGTLDVVRKLEGVDWPHAVARTMDSKYLVALDNARLLNIWDTSSWENRRFAVPAWGGHIQVHPSAHRILLAENAAPEQGLVFVADLDNEKVVAEKDFPAGDNVFAYAPDGDRIYWGSKDGVQVLDANSMKTLDRWPQAITPFGAVSDTKNGYFINFDSEGLHVWDVKSGAKKTDLPIVAKNLYPVTGRPGQFIARLPYTKGVGTRLVLLDTDTLLARELLVVDGNVQTLSSAAGLIAVAHTGYVNGELSLPITYSGTVDIYDLKRVKRLQRIAVPIRTEEGVLSFITNPTFEAVSLNADGSQVAVLTGWIDGFRTGGVVSKQLRVFNTRTGKLQQAVDAYRDMSDARFDESDKRIINITTHKGTYLHDLSSGKQSGKTAVRSYEKSLSLADGKSEVRFGQTFIEIANASGERLFLRQLDNLEALGAFDNPNRLVLLNSANEVSFLERSR